MKSSLSTIVPLPSSIEGVSGEKEIVDRKHFCDLLNCVNECRCVHDCEHLMMIVVT